MTMPVELTDFLSDQQPLPAPWQEQKWWQTERPCRSTLLWSLKQELGSSGTTNIALGFSTRDPAMVKALIAEPRIEGVSLFGGGTQIGHAHGLGLAMAVTEWLDDPTPVTEEINAALKRVGFHMRGGTTETGLFRNGYVTVRSRGLTIIITDDYVQLTSSGRKQDGWTNILRLTPFSTPDAPPDHPALPVLRDLKSLQFTMAKAVSIACKTAELLKAGWCPRDPKQCSKRLMYKKLGLDPKTGMTIR